MSWGCKMAKKLPPFYTLPLYELNIKNVKKVV